MCLSVLSCTCNIWYTYRSWHVTLYCVWCFWEIIKLFPCTTWSLMEESGYRVTNGTTTLDVRTQPSYLLNTDGTVLWYCQCIYQCGGALLCDTVSACTNVSVLCCMILWVPVPMWQCSVVWYCECLYECVSALCCDIVSACINVTVFVCVILSVPVPMWRCFVVWYCQCLYQYDSALLCYTVSACTSVAVLLSWNAPVLRSVTSFVKPFSYSLKYISVCTV